MDKGWDLPKVMTCQRTLRFDRDTLGTGARKRKAVYLVLLRPRFCGPLRLTIERPSNMQKRPSNVHVQNKLD